MPASPTQTRLRLMKQCSRESRFRRRSRLKRLRHLFLSPTVRPWFFPERLLLKALPRRSLPRLTPRRNLGKFQRSSASARERATKHPSTRGSRAFLFGGGLAFS